MIRQDWSTLKKLMFMKTAAGGAAAVEATATGNPLTFVTDLARPLKSLLIPFTPQQEGTGDPSPSNIRSILPWNGLTVWNGGVNTFDGELEKGYINTQGQNASSNDNVRSKNYIPVVPGTQYYVKFERSAPGASNMRVFFYSADKTYISNGWRGTGTMNIPSDAYFIRFYMDSAYTAGTDRNIAINYPATETSYEAPHITETDIVFPAMGKNLLDITKTSKIAPGERGSTITIADGVISIDAIATSARTFVMFSQEFPAGTYTIQGKFSGASSGLRLISDVEFDGSTYNSYYSGYIKAISVSAGSLTFVLPSAGHIGLNINNKSGESGEPASAYDIQLEARQTASAYEPFTNAVYGDTVDPVSGVLTVKRVSISKKWSEWEAQSVGSTHTRKTLLFNDPVKGASTYAWSRCNVAPQDWNTSQNTHFYIDENKAYVWLPNETDGDLVVQVAGVLVTPQEIQLTHTQLTALVGNNTIWSDADGNLTVTYLKKG